MEKFECKPFEIFDRKWALLTAGGKDGFNPMTISWGGLGTLWNKPIVTVYVKPIRFTHEFMERSDYFTVGFYPEAYRRALTLCGSISGRNCNKAERAGLTPEFLEHAVTFSEAELTLVCKKLYRQELDVSAMPKDAVKNFYTEEAAHTMYLGEVVSILR